uniref:Ig-like domain-containing protein n=1 Tax=Leptobrachium leishanense TaxID=445787 RepID=A0A8C5Q1E2_9ANUR
MQVHYLALCFIILSLFTPCSLSQSIITQHPPAYVVHPGENLTLACTVTNTADPYMYWYRQRFHGGSMEFICLSAGAGSVEKPELPNFTAERISESQFSLNMERINVTDAGVYYCAWSHTEEQVQGRSVQ